MGTVIGPIDFATAGALKADVKFMEARADYDPEIIQRHKDLYKTYITTEAA